MNRRGINKKKEFLELENKQEEVLPKSQEKRFKRGVASNVKYFYKGKWIKNRKVST